MEALIKAAIPAPFHLLGRSAAIQRPPNHLSVCRSRKNGEVNGLYSTPSPSGSEDQGDEQMPEETIQPSNLEAKGKHADIWRLFKEAQQNILFLNKQRLLVTEELEKANREKQLLLDQIEHFQLGNQAVDGRVNGTDRLSIFWELLHRIDSMVLTRKVTIEEASNWRRLIMDSKVSIADVFSDVLDQRDSELLEKLRHFADGSKRNGFHIVQICTEMEPLVYVGSLASYVTGLSRALQRKGHTVEVVLPKYARLNLGEVQGLREIEAEFYSYYNGQLHGNRIWTGIVRGIGVTLIEPIFFSSFFSREKIYGYSDDFERFAYFSRAALDYLVKAGKKPDVLHIHDWQTSIVGPLFWDMFVKLGLEGTKILLTCHDLNSQCLEQPDKLGLSGLEPARLHRPDRFQDNARASLVNLLKGGIVYSNKVVIISSMHSKGRIIRYFGYGLEPTLATHKDKLLIAPSGFDNSIWDPLKDKFLPKNYSADDLEGKAVCKVALQHHVGLPKDASVAVVGWIYREVSDIDLKTLKTVAQSITHGGGQLLLARIDKMTNLDRTSESFVKDLKDENVRFIDRFDEALSHLIFAGSDIILCQSFEDPTLQVPMKALKYGAAPVALSFSDDRSRHVVELNHDISEYAQFIKSTFENISLSQALDEMRSNPSKWKRKMADAMDKDFSWDAETCDVHISAYAALEKL
ncbi:glycogen synthase isoform X2 [Eucalyptus grandis]|uniref:glycogen synthase isoform X2 n=1 Tax=Eucalyptus grandis TaxID=71139 RepID=UPI00192F0BBA|nr:glycogen synthase isoform X2 [Eucalyptus grandis]